MEHVFKVGSILCLLAGAYFYFGLNKPNIQEDITSQFEMLKPYIEKNSRGE